MESGRRRGRRWFSSGTCISRELFSASPQERRGATTGQHPNLSQARGSGTGESWWHLLPQGQHPAPGLWRSVLFSAGNLSGERRGFRAEAALLSQCESFFWIQRVQPGSNWTSSPCTWLTRAASRSARTWFFPSSPIACP